MAKTKELSCLGTEGRVTPGGRDRVIVLIENPDIDDILGGMDKDDIDEWVKDNREPEDIFSETQLENWATANGYVKSNE